MATMRQWLQVRTRERLDQMLALYAELTGTQPIEARNLSDQEGGFAMKRIAELQARVDALEAHVEALLMNETRH